MIQRIFIEPDAMFEDGGNVVHEVVGKRKCFCCAKPIGDGPALWIIPEDIPTDFFIHPECEEHFMRTETN